MRHLYTGLILLSSLLVSPIYAATEPLMYEYEVLNRLPHDPKAYTQGLLFYDGHFYESTGLKGRSSLRRVDPDSGWPGRIVSLPQRFFGEGLALVDDTLIQLTWQSGVAFVYARDTFELLREHRYEGEGWGLAYDGSSLIMSDGSDRLYFRDPDTFAIRRVLRVTDEGRPLSRLNELEHIDGEIWANVYGSHRIVRISPDSGAVLSRIDFNELPAPDERNGQEDVLNGIAYDAEQKRLFITGKLYSYIYEIKLHPR